MLPILPSRNKFARPWVVFAQLSFLGNFSVKKLITICLFSVLAACSDAKTPYSTPPAKAPQAPQKKPVDAPPPICTPTDNVDVHLHVAATRGPQGGTPAVISPNLYSMNIDDQIRSDYVPHAPPEFVAFLKAIKPPMLRWPAGHYGQQYQFSRNAAEGPFSMTPQLIDAFMELAQNVGAKPLMAVNIVSGTPESAADFVRYVNIEKNYGVTWWQIGNEPDLNGVSEKDNPQAYALTYLKFAEAMKRVDPTIKLVGAEIMTGANILAINDNVDWLTPILASAGQSMDAIAWHYYPLDSSQVSETSSATANVYHLIQEAAEDWPPAGLNFADQVSPVLNAKRQQFAPQAQIWVDEYAEDSGKLNGAGLGDRMVGALWAADVMGRFASQSTDAMFHFMFKGGAEHKYTLIAENFAPRPEYYTYWLLSQHFGDRMVQSESDARWQVSPHAAVRSEDQTLRVMIVNKMETDKKVRLQIDDFVPRTAERYELVGTSYDSMTATLNDATLNMSNIDKGEDAIAPLPAEACADTSLTLPAFSVTLFIFRP